ncbi:MAG: hypothetical protein A2857_00800 [Candidatus Levybacteria bacterium RIFCSPHIGHO2_01_FULL_36_15]|nr:MAG: hypothetical protein A2857_00800 [Candidatus Levybacteria bacterium RIFCSPHIGHO2_01_FULL_36_15]OGH37281.1 MAG: hypothetical protein A2905_01090 [Candidatus Levybacteria bacterium RIFCSPLOWO2_01_FULL_36_10]
MIVAVGSKNKTKINPVKKIFSRHFKDIKVVGVNVLSGVRDQPMEDGETFKGALNRASQALKKIKDAEYGVGIEGGFHKYSYGWFERSIVVVVDRNGDIGIGSSGGVVMPEKIIKRIKKGENLSQAIDATFGTKNIGKGIGMFGVFTKGAVTRTKAVEHGVAFALSRFLHKNLYQDK